MSGTASVGRQVSFKIVTECSNADTAGSEAAAAVLTVMGQVAGLAVTRPEWEVAGLAASYSAELGPRPARLHHLLIAPVFQRLAR